MAADLAVSLAGLLHFQLVVDVLLQLLFRVALGSLGHLEVFVRKVLPFLLMPWAEPAVARMSLRVVPSLTLKAAQTSGGMTPVSLIPL